jgi:hypothetical protein
MRKSFSALVVCTAVLLSVAGATGFILLFVPRINVYWIILAPVIFAVYQIPAVIVYAFWKRKRSKGLAGPDDSQVPVTGENEEPPADPE